MAACPTLSTGDAFLSTLLRHIDCQAQTIGGTGYQAMADPASPFAMVLTTVLTIFIGLFGLRLVLGETPTLRDSVMAVVKIGIVLVLATSWPAYRTLVYDVIVYGPGQLGAAIGRPVGLPGTDGELISRLQTSDVAISRLITLGSGRNDLTSREPADTDGLITTPPRAPFADDPAFGSARVLFLSATVAAFAVVRLMAGVLLALGPLFAGLLLFDIARGLFVGWVRGLIFTMLASLAVTIILGVELALLEPWLSQVLQLRNANLITAAAPVELLVLCLAFALALVGSLGVILRLAFTLSLPFGQASASSPSQAADQPAFAMASSDRPMPSDRPVMDRPSPRAEAVAGALMTAQRRERAQMSADASVTVRSRPSTNGTVAPVDAFAIPTFGQTLRRAKPRKSIGAALRDRRS